MLNVRLISLLFSKFVVATKHQIWSRANGSSCNCNGAAMADRQDKTVRQRGKPQSRYAPNLMDDDETTDDKMNRRTKSLPAPPAFEGPLAPNNKLQKAEKILDGQILGPESMERGRGGFYTGLADGRIVKIVRNEVTDVAIIGKPPCGGEENEHTCGRPLGMRFHKDGNLYVIDAYSGIHVVYLQTGDVVEIFSSRTPIDGRPLKLMNDLDINSEDYIYFTDSSDKFERRQNRLMALEGSATGRVFQYNPYTEEAIVLMDGLAFPNGIQLSPEEDYSLICETLRVRILKYHLDGPKQGMSEIFADNLPGLPDNIRYSNNGGYWVGFAAIRKQPFSMYDFMASKPWIRTVFAKLFNPEMIMSLVPKYGLVVEFDENGKILQSLHDPTGEVISGVSEVLDLGSSLYLGSYNAPFVGKLENRYIHP